MKSKLGILGAIVLSLTIAGSAFAATNTATGKIVNKAAAVKTANKTAKTAKTKKHRRKKAAKKSAAMKKSAPAKKATK